LPSRFKNFNLCLWNFLKTVVDATAVGPLYWDLVALRDLLGAIETLEAINYEAYNVSEAI